MRPKAVPGCWDDNTWKPKKMIVKILDVVLAGLLLGGIYALTAMGLSLQYGVARVLNIAHGDFIMVGAFLTWTLFALCGVNPLLSMVITGPVVFIIGFMLYVTLYTRLRVTSPNAGVYEGKSMLASFGLLFIIQNVAILIWGADIKAYSYLSVGVDLGGAIFAANRLVTLLIAAIIGGVFFLFLARTRTGKAIRAAAQDPEAAGYMGVNIKWVLALCFGLGAMMAGIGGTLISICYPIQPTMGFQYTMIAIIVVVLGGMGSIPGSFVGGLILGLVGSIVTYFEPALSLAAYYVIFMLLLLIKPTGIMGK
jgi:branched-chain amino acid transport system permease protein